MIEIADTLVRNGHHLQHFVRELARYFRNLLVTKIAGGNPRLIAASREERARLAEIAAAFSEQDLTRYLQLTLDLFRDMQFSLQPRLHFELGLIRLVEAGRLISIEEALASAGGAIAPVKASPPPPAAAPAATGGLKERLAAALRELGMAFTADAVEHSALEESAGLLQFTTPAEFELAMRPADIQKALDHLKAGKRRIKVGKGEVAPPAAPAETARAGEDETMQRALAHPEVQRFREAFPDAEVRVARNLKE
jgi:DNA polymerase-3 subunit gamma/tau